MAKLNYSGFEVIDNNLAKLGRESIRRLVEAGAKALIQEVQGAIDSAHHVVTGSMRDSVQTGQYHETLGGGWMDVYPQGDDSRGISNTTKAFVINYGYGKRRTDRTGDHFITGKKHKYESAVSAAMKKENETIINEVNGG